MKFEEDSTLRGKKSTSAITSSWSWCLAQVKLLPSRQVSTLQRYENSEGCFATENLWPPNHSSTTAHIPSRGFPLIQQLLSPCPLRGLLCRAAAFGVQVPHVCLTCLLCGAHRRPCTRGMIGAGGVLSLWCLHCGSTKRQLGRVPSYTNQSQSKLTVRAGGKCPYCLFHKNSFEDEEPEQAYTIRKLQASRCFIPQFQG